MWRLVDYYDSTKVFEMRAYPIIIGRNGNANLVCRHGAVSKNHAAIHKDGDNLYLIANKSKNNTYLNDDLVELHKRTDLKENDIIGIATCIDKKKQFEDSVPHIYRLEFSNEPPMKRLRLDKNIKNESNSQTRTNSNFDITKVKNEPFEIVVIEDSDEEEKIAVKSNNTLCARTTRNNKQCDMNTKCKNDIINIGPGRAHKLTAKHTDKKHNIDFDIITIDIDNTKSMNKKDSETDCIEIIAKEHEIINENTVNNDDDKQHMDADDMCIEIIDILDSDDEDNVVCTQLNIKKETPFVYDQIYHQIKQELDELDKIDGLQSPVPVDDSDDDDNLNSQDLLDMLNKTPSECSNEGKSSFENEPSVCHKCGSNDKALPKEVQKNKIVDQKSRSSEAAVDKLVERKKRDVKHSNSIVTFAENVEKENVKKKPERKSLKKLVSEITAKNKPKALTMIEPLPISKGRRLSTSASVKSPPRKDINSRKGAAAIRKNKMKVKVSKSRGLFLMENLDLKPKCKKSTATLMSENTLKEKQVHHQPNNCKETLSEVPSTSTSTSLATKASITQSTKKISKLSVDKITSIVIAKPLTRNGLTSRPSSRNSKNSASSFKLSRELYNLERFVNKILSWRKYMFYDQTKFVEIWKLISGKELLKNRETYRDSDAYATAMEQIIISDIFSEVHQEYSMNPTPESHQFICEDLSESSYFAELKCVAFINATNYHKRNFLKEGDLIHLTYKVKNCERYTFGIVKQTKIMDNSVQIPIKASISKSYKLAFVLLVTKGRQPETKQKINYRMLCGISRHMKRLLVIKRAGELGDHILNPLPEHFKLPDDTKHIDVDVSHTKLNREQENALLTGIDFCLGQDKQKIMLLEGPPGTGKSMLIVNMLMEIVQRLQTHEAVLVLAQSNAAVDNLLEKFKRLQSNLSTDQKNIFKCVRIGQRSYATPLASGYHLDNLSLYHMKNSLIANTPELAREYDRVYAKYLKDKNLQGKNIENMHIHKPNIQEMFVKQQYLRSFNNEFWKVKLHILEGARIVFSTISSCPTLLLEMESIKLTFSCCIIDEATQANEPDTLLPLLLGVNKFILIGDTLQLPPHCNLIPKEYLFNRSLFDRLKSNLRQSRNYTIDSLIVQYRMVESICAFPNNMFYNGKLKSYHKRTPRKDLKCLQPYILFEQSGSSSQDDTYVNKSEINTIHNIIHGIDHIIRSEERLGIVIITPYNNQKEEVTKSFSNLKVPNNISLSCHTIDGFQGREADIVILSLVRNASNQFTNDSKRINVALTRARSCLYIVGSFTLFQDSTLLGKVRTDATMRNIYKTNCTNLTLVTTALRRKEE